MDASGVGQIVSALELVHSPKSSNPDRQEAQSFLEQVKKQEESPLWGYELALPNENAVVRHFGLTLLQHSINRNWYDYDNERRLAIRNWIVELASKLQETDPHYLREKLAFIWVSVAKRCWGSYLVKEEVSFDDLLQGWASMDQDLWNLWSASSQTRELTLIIFRTLFEDVYILDDPIAVKSSGVLTTSCSSVIFPETLYAQLYEVNPNLKQAKAVREGWFLIWQEYLNESVRNGDERALIKVLETFKTCLNWPSSEILTLSQILKSLMNALLVSNSQVKILTIDCLHALFTRSYNQRSDEEQIIGTVFKPEGIQLLTNIYNSIKNDPDDIDDEAYMFTKKLIEMVVELSEHIPILDTSEADLDGYFKLVLSSLNNPSPTVSGISLHFWGYMIRDDEKVKLIEKLFPDLIEVAASKLLNYSDLTEDDVSQKFLSNDYNSAAESYTYLGGYKRLLEDVVRIVICLKPEFGLAWLNQRLENFFGSEIGQTTLNSTFLDYHSQAFVLIISQFDITEACVRGVIRWKICYDKADYNEKLEILVAEVENLLEKLLNVEIKDPVVLKKFTQTAVQFTPLLRKQSTFKIIERLLTMSTLRAPEGSSEEQVALFVDLRASCGTELNRIAFIMPGELKDILDDLENVFQSLLPRLSPPEAIFFKSFLLVVSQRSDINNKEERFYKVVEPEFRAWNDSVTIKGLSDLPWFMERLGIVQIAEYFESRKISPDADLFNIPMDDAGLKLKSELKDRWSALFPIRSTRILIQYSIEKLPHDSVEFKNLVKYWRPIVTPIIPHILQLLYQIQAYHNPDNWKTLPEIVQSFVKYTTVERFWQMGVSIQTRDSFLEESVKAMHTLRDFADSVGHIVRYTREYVFLSLSSITELDDVFYSIPDIANIFWRAATGEKVGITLHSWKHMINLMLRSIIKNCPPERVFGFMSELLPQVFTTLDELMVTHWEKVYISDSIIEGNDQQLSDEMMEEHLLRQLTQIVIRSLIDCVGQYSLKKPLTDTQLEIRRLIFKNKAILAPFLNLLCHLVMIKDSKCSFNVILILRAILNDIMLKDDEVDKFLCENLTKALLHVLTERAYEDGQSDAAYMMTSLYINMRTRGVYIVNVIKSCLPLATDEIFQELDTSIAQSKSSRERRNAFFFFIQKSKVQEVDDVKLKKDRNKQLERVNRRKKNETDIMNDPFVENDALGNLFGGK